MSDASLGDESPVRLSDPDPRWRGQFRDLSRRVRLALGAKVLELHHAGSTWVQGLAGKPVIDMVLVVADSADEEPMRRRSPLRGSG